jgi:arylsulfatase A-like enzyme
MKKYSFLFLLMGYFVSGFAQQNTILIIADDVSPDYFGFYTTTKDTAKAPHIRSLLSKGIQFTKVWSAPVCSPARAGIFTGRYPFRTGVGTVITNAASAQLDTAEMSLAKLLKWYAPIHYNTANVGKWHLHLAMPAKLLYPNLLGYDFYSGNFSGQLSNYYSYQRIKNGIIDTVNNYATTQTVDDAISWMDTMNSSKPFFLWLAFNAPHFPFHLPPASLCDTTGLPGSTADINTHPTKYFKAAIEAMDTEIGRLFQYLNTHNLMDSTNIIFMGDNGNEVQVAQLANPNKAKATIYDYGSRVPMIVSGPAVVNSGRITDTLVSTVDLFATIAELSGFLNWKNFIPVGTVVDSRSMMPIIKNQAGFTRSWIFTDQFANPGVPADGKTIRNRDYQLLRFDNGNEEFYNQTLDFEENNNLLLSSSVTATDISNYEFLCDSLNALMGSGTCKPLGIQDISAIPTVSIYPNPANHFLQVESQNAINNIKLFDELGNLIRVSSHSSMQLDGISSGIYFITIIFNNQQTIHKKIQISK